MEHLSLQALFDFIWSNDTLLLLLGLMSFVSFIASLILIPFLVVRIPADYFSEQKRQVMPWAQHHLFLRWLLLILKNLLGMVFVVLGLAMLVLPGQGLITIFIGILLLNFPGKYRFERSLIQYPAISRSIDWLRTRAGREPLKF